MKENKLYNNLNVPEELLCDLCGHIFQNVDNYRKHIQDAHKDVQSREQFQYQCKECADKFETRSDLNHRVSQSHNGGKYFVTRKELRDHNKNFHEPSISGNEEFVAKLSKTLQSLLTNEDDVKENKEKENIQPCPKFKCVHCKGFFQTNASLKKHIKQLHKVYTVNQIPARKSPVLEAPSSTHSKDLNTPSTLECGMCDIQFESIGTMNDDKHGGRWRYGDENEESISTDYTSTDVSDSEDSEIISEEVSI